MSTPTKPERVEVGTRWRNKATGQEYEVESIDDDLIYPVTFKGGGAWELDMHGMVLVAPAPATPGTATVTPDPECECTGADNRHWGECPMVAVDNEMRAAKAASKSPASPVGPPASCLMEQWDGATFTPRSALQAIQAKREPEPWVESCDLLHWLRDA